MKAIRDENPNVPIMIFGGVFPILRIDAEFEPYRAQPCPKLFNLWASYDGIREWSLYGYHRLVILRDLLSQMINLITLTGWMSECIVKLKIITNTENSRR